MLPSAAELWEAAGEVLALYPVWFYGVLAVWGAFWASFLNLVAWRLPAILARFQGGRGPEGFLQPLTLWGRSSCDHCAAPIPWYRNIPVWAWCWQRGRTACCGKPLGRHHVLGEALWMVALPVMGGQLWSSPVTLFLGYWLATVLYVAQGTAFGRRVGVAA